MDATTSRVGEGSSRRRLAAAILVGLALVAGGTAIAAWTTTGGGDVTLSETTIETESALDLAATVYEPDGASPDDPAPAVVLIHGYTGERGTMSSFATELADRGYVAVTVDQPGHGDSEPPAFADGWGGPAALEHTRSLETVDEDRVALAGHSMGGFASLAAAADQPEGYESIVLLGSTWNYSSAPAANETVPRNMAVVFSPYDEFAPEMWNESVPGDVHRTEKLAAAFGTDPPVERGETYGSVADGTARVHTAPPTIHTGMHRSTATVDDTIAWIDRTIGDPAERTGAGAETDGAAGATDQRWYWATIGHVLTFLGALVVATGTTALVWRRLDRGASDGAPSAAATTAASGAPVSRSTSVALAALPAIAFYPFYAIGTVAVPVTRLTHQQLTHGYVLWAIGTVALAAGVVGWRRGGLDRTALESVRPSRPDAIRALVAAVAGAGALYVLAAIVAWFPGGDLRAWMIGLGSLSPSRWFSAAVYVVPFTVATLGLSIGLDRLRPRSGSLGADLGRGLALTCGGLLVFLVVQYVPLFLGRGMLVPALGPLAISGLSAIGLAAVATGVAIAATRLTDSPLPGGLLAGLLVTWIVVATGPIHVAPF